MKRTVFTGFILLLVLGGCLALAVSPASADAVMNVREFRVTTNTSDQNEPDIDGIHVVWQDNRNGNWDIYLYTLQGTFDPETRVTTNASDQQYPAISGNRIVWQDNRNGNWDIYLYDLQTRNETRITPGSPNRQYPAISGDRIVWQDDRNGNQDIYLYDLKTGNETRITIGPENHLRPAISGNKIVWQEYRDGTYAIGMFDLATGNETVATSGSYELKLPAVSGGRVVWQETTHDFSPYYSFQKVFFNDTATGAEWRSVNSQSNQENPDIDGNYIVYHDNRNSFWEVVVYYENWDIYLYNLDTQTESRITDRDTNPYNTWGQYNPAISGSRIVYQDDRNGNWDIYLAELSYSVPPMTTPTPGPQSVPSPSIGSLYVSSIPTNATILMNGTPSGRTDRFVTVPAGTWNLTLTKAGYEPYTKEIAVAAGTLKAVPAITLEKGGGPSAGVGSLFVSSVPTNATILMNGTPSGRTNRFVTVPAGTWNLTLTKAGYEPHSELVTVAGGTVRVLPVITLVKGGGPGPSGGSGILYVASSPTGATILVNGTSYGETDRFVSVPAGTWNLTLVKSGYQPFSMTVTVPAGRVTVLPAVTLVPETQPVPGKIEAFIAALEREGFTVQKGKLEKFDIVSMYNARLIPGCFGNNPSTPYLAYKLPPYPGLTIGGVVTDAPIHPENKGLWLDYFMEPDEAIVYVGETPPEVKYFSYRSYVSNRRTPGGYRQLFASLGDQLNYVRIRTDSPRGSDPFDKPVMIITTADRGTNELVREAALEAGYPVGMVNDDIIPSGLIRMGRENTSDTITVVHRVTLFANATLGSEYVNSTHGTVLRLTPTMSHTPQPYGVPPLIVRGTGNTRELDLNEEQEALKQSIIARMGAGKVVSGNKTAIFVFEGYDSLQREVSAQGDNRDTVYLSNGNYTLKGDEFIVVYGVNHQRTGKATYTNAAVYGTAALNGVAAITNSEYAGSADPYLPGNENSGLFYVWKFARHCNGEPGCTEVPSCCGGAGIPEDVPVMIGFRAYVEPETGVGPSWTEVLYDQAIHFAPA